MFSAKMQLLQRYSYRKDVFTAKRHSLQGHYCKSITARVHFIIGNSFTGTAND
ncbi:hypothetical protein [Bacteroides caecimuris]|uniref:hypothetical protein n=1 Tax=Bacteroides caecimuris TaxID=1796613 RepID=UPI002658766C|nr:hypothetical protein [Bacteroides caecimuris]